MHEVIKEEINITSGASLDEPSEYFNKINSLHKKRIWLKSELVLNRRLKNTKESNKSSIGSVGSDLK